MFSAGSSYRPCLGDSQKSGKWVWSTTVSRCSHVPPSGSGSDRDRDHQVLAHPRTRKQTLGPAHYRTEVLN